MPESVVTHYAYVFIFFNFIDIKRNDVPFNFSDK